MADAAVRADLAEALDRLRALAAQVALDLEVRVDVLAERVTSSSVRSRTFLSGESPSAAQILRAVDWPIP